MAFRNHSTLTPYGAPVIRRDVLANSVTFKVGDVVRTNAGFIALGTTATAPYGVLLSIGTDKGVGLNTSGAAGSQIGSFVDRFLTTSDNQTVAKVRGEIDISMFTIYSADIDATPGTTTGSNLLGYYIDIADETELDESTAAATLKQFHTLGLDPNDSTRVLVNLVESSVFNVAA